MNATKDVRKYAAEQGIAEEEALKKGMEAKSKEFVEKGAEVYGKVRCMSDTICQKTDDGLEILRRLALQFSENLKTALSNPLAEGNRVELKARCLSSVGLILRSKCATSATQNEIASIYDEIFADCICSLYLAAQGLDKPAQIVLRRVLELGVAAVYLWDVPHVFWGWKAYDKDLSFNEMTEQLSALPYLHFVASENGKSDPTPIFDVTLARKEYRALSNTVHGKVTSFETPLGDRFRHSDADWKLHVSRLEAIQDLLLDLSRGRFSKVREGLPIAQPQLISLL